MSEKDVRPGEKINLKIQRYDPSKPSPPRFETYSVPATKYMRVMDVLEALRENGASDLAFRAYCGAKRCGGCGMKINGRPGLACWEQVQKEMTLEPMDNFPIVRDLVVDVSAYEFQKKRVQPLLERRDAYKKFPEEISHEQIIPSFKLMDCIECQLCTSVCAVLKAQNFRENRGTNSFAGPAVLVQIAKVSLDPRSSESLADLALAGNIQDCHSCNSCSEVCPNNIDVLRDAIDPLREKLIQRKKYRVRGWTVIRRLNPKLRAFLRCKLGLTLGESVS